MDCFVKMKLRGDAAHTPFLRSTAILFVGCGLMDAVRTVEASATGTGTSDHRGSRGKGMHTYERNDFFVKKLNVDAVRVMMHDPIESLLGQGTLWMGLDPTVAS